MQWVRVRLTRNSGRASILLPINSNMACERSPFSVQRGPVHMKTCLVWVLINGFRALPQLGRNSCQNTGKIKRVRSEAIRLNRPPRYKLTNHTAGGYPGSRVASIERAWCAELPLPDLRLPVHCTVAYRKYRY